MSLRVTAVPAHELTPSQLAMWAKFQASCPAWSHPVLSPTFALAVHHVRGDVEIALMSEDSQIQGFLAFHRLGRHGWPVGLETSDLQSPILAPGYRLDPHVFLEGTGLTAWHFDHLVSEPSGFDRYVRAVDPASYIDLSNGFSAYRDHLKSHGQTWTQSQRKLRKLERDYGPIKFVWHRPENVELDCLIAWKQQQVAMTGGSGMLTKDWVRRLLRHCATLDAAECSGVLSVLMAGSHTVAVHLGLRSSSVLCSWIPAYRSEFAPYSPGLILHLKLAEAAAEHGVQRIDLGLGQNQMKRSLQTGTCDLAIGSVDQRWCTSVFSRPWYYLRAKAHQMPIAQRPLRWFRHCRELLARVPSKHR